MIKQPIPGTRRIARPLPILLLCWAITGFSGCNTPRAKPDGIIGALPSPAPLPPPIRPALHASPQPWTLEMRGLISEVNVSENGKSLLVATVPDPEGAGGSRRPELSMVSRAGKRLWTKELQSPVRAQSLSSDGERAFVSTYDDRLTAYARSGKQLWAIDGMCRPIPLDKLDKTGKVLCYHDEDAETEIAFEILDRKGKRLLTVPAPGEVLALRLSADQRLIALSMAGGKIAAYGPTFKPLWQGKVDGEVAALSARSPHTLAAIVDRRDAPTREVPKPPARRHWVQLQLDTTPPLQWTAPAEGRLESLEFSASGKLLVGYSATTRGRVLEARDLTADTGTTERWKILQHPAEDFGPQLAHDGELVAVPMDDRSGAAGHSHLLIARDATGELLWNLSVPTSEEASLYVFDVAGPGRFAAIGTDDRMLVGFPLTPR